MVITHQDRNGQFWRFNIDCTNEQGEKIRRALAGVRNMGRARNLSITELTEEYAAGDLFANVEAALLRGLADTFPVRAALEPQGLRPGVPTEPQPVQAAPSLFPEAAADEPAPRFWWERD